MGERVRYVTDGAKDFVAVLKRHELTIASFSKLTGLDRVELQRVANGERQRVTVDQAFEICEAVEKHLGEQLTLKRFANSKHVRKLLFEQRCVVRNKIARTRSPRAA